MSISHILGFPRIGVQRELKTALESYWQGQLSQTELLEKGKQLRATHWQLQADAGLNFVTAGDFAWYDHVLEMSVLLGVVPQRFNHTAGQPVALDTLFRMARGRAPTGTDVPACEMTKWFDTNYHYIVPEFATEQTFSLSNTSLFEQVDEAKALGHTVKPVIMGPLTYLWLGKSIDENFDKLNLLPRLLKSYQQILDRLSDQGVEWIQMDEPILVLDLPAKWQAAFISAYSELKFSAHIMLATYFGALADNWRLIHQLPVSALHIDLVRGAMQTKDLFEHLPKEMILSVGIVDGRNIWRTDLQKAMETIKAIKQKLGDRVWVSASCSLLHSPVDLDKETTINPQIKQWLAFAKQKCYEIAALAKGLSQGEASIGDQLKESEKAVNSRRESTLIHNPEVQQRLRTLTPAMADRQNIYAKRYHVQQTELKLPLFPTTTIGSFPQTAEIRHARSEWKAGRLNDNNYKKAMEAQIKYAVEQQEALGLDVLVHGEAERNDMVEYFGELLEGFAFTRNGWVQSYGSRCVKPPIIYGDVSRPQPMTVEWIKYAQNLTQKFMKGMLTGPTTILCWSFVRDDQPRMQTALQIALALRDEVCDLEQAGIKIIQIDEPAFREGLPLRHREWPDYLEWAAHAFRIAASGVQDSTQIHTHMCYSEFNDIIESIAELDADVITIETSRSHMELLHAFEKFEYPNSIGPGVYDIHSPRIPNKEEIINLMHMALAYIPAERLWVNPDCGLKTRGWIEVRTALEHMVQAAQQLRAEQKVKHIAKESV